MKNTTITLASGEKITLPKEEYDAMIAAAKRNSQKPWRPKLQEKYWYVHSGGDVDWYKNYDNGAEVDYRYYTGNCFKTKEEAEVSLQKMQALKRINRYIFESGLCFYPDEDNYFREEKHGIKGWDYHWDKPAVYSNININHSRYTDCSQYGLVFRTKKHLDRVIEACSNDLKILLK